VENKPAHLLVSLKWVGKALNGLPQPLSRQIGSSWQLDSKTEKVTSLSPDSIISTTTKMRKVPKYKQIFFKNCKPIVARIIGAESREKGAASSFSPPPLALGSNNKYLNKIIAIMLHLIQICTIMNKFERFFQLKHAYKWIILVVNLQNSPSAGGPRSG